MIRKIINNSNESDDIFYKSEIDKSKLILWLKVITEKYRDEVKDRILTCIDICTDDNFDINKTIDEIMVLLSDELILENMSDLDVWKLYESLWENYFLMWEFNKALENYYRSFEKWNTSIFEKIISIKVFLKLPYKKQSELDSGDFDFSNILSELNENQKKYDFWDEMKVDLEEFLEWWFDFIDVPDTLQAYIYNLEVTEEKWLTKLQGMEYVSELEYKKAINRLLEAMYKMYMQIAEAIEHADYVYLSMWNMVKRLEWEDIDYLEHWKELRKFIDVWFDFLKIYQKEWKDNFYDVLEFIFKNWFRNLWDSQKIYIANKFSDFLKWNDNLDYDKINSILLNVTFESSMWYTTMIEMWDIFRKIWKYWNSFSFYITARERGLYVDDRLAKLVEDILLNKEFKWTSWINVEFILADVIDKINRDNLLNFKDIENIKYACNV